MEREERLITRQAEEHLINMILGEVIENKITISNIKKATEKVIGYMESNAVLEMAEMEDLDDAKSSI